MKGKKAGKVALLVAASAALVATLINDKKVKVENRIEEKQE
ncbi:hypothetical protein [Clostridium chauvoei]|uniref:Uncharacterized protein n=1 Tax=Clostridium chauvoei JF4335 TaxID=1351755 RepID=S6EY36_9CLOT|nr:hypothetical protein [Clostridium chauvoei]CDG01196.1 Hypothetical protein CCH01_004820 [Clostridium chauvoei JF4335]SLK15031.1 Hypothetical protein CCH01_08010 [Clostridium chauvoei JF4335]